MWVNPTVTSEPGEKIQAISGVTENSKKNHCGVNPTILDPKSPGGGCQKCRQKDVQLSLHHGDNLCCWLQQSQCTIWTRGVKNVFPKKPSEIPEEWIFHQENAARWSILFIFVLNSCCEENCYNLTASCWTSCFFSCGGVEEGFCSQFTLFL